MKKLAILLLGICLLAACGSDVTSAESVAPDQNQEARIDTVTYTQLVPCTTYVHDTSIVTTVDTVIETVYGTVQDTILVNDTVYLVDTFTVVKYDTTIKVIHDTLVVTPDTPETGALDTLPRLPSDVPVEWVQFILSENTLVLGLPEDYATVPGGGNVKTISLILQTATGIDTLKNQKVDFLSTRPTLIKVKPIDKCIGILGFDAGDGWLEGYAFKVCDEIL